MNVNDCPYRLLRTEREQQLDFKAASLWPNHSPSCTQNLEDQANGIFSAMSRHTGGAQFLLGDGSVRFISENVDTGNLAWETQVDPEADIHASATYRRHLAGVRTARAARAAAAHAASRQEGAA